MNTYLSSWAPVKSVAAKFLQSTQVAKFGPKDTTRRAAINLVKAQALSAAGARSASAFWPTHKQSSFPAHCLILGFATE